MHTEVSILLLYAHSCCSIPKKNNLEVTAARTTEYVKQNANLYYKKKSEKFYRTGMVYISTEKD